MLDSRLRGNDVSGEHNDKAEFSKTDRVFIKERIRDADFRRSLCSSGNKN